jgi:hypothetical protein
MSGIMVRLRKIAVIGDDLGGPRGIQGKAKGDRATTELIDGVAAP